jgi:hypothetical protein
MRKCVILYCVAVAIIGCGAKIETTDQPAQSAQAKSEPAEAMPSEQRAQGSQVTATLQLSKDVVRNGEEVDVAIELKIAPLWEIHPLGSQPEEAATRLELITPEGIRTESEWIEPQTTRSLGASGQPVHMGKVVFRRTLVIGAAKEGTHSITCKMRYQVCNERQCLKPETLTLQVPLVVRE